MMIVYQSKYQQHVWPWNDTNHYEQIALGVRQRHTMVGPLPIIHSQVYCICNPERGGGHFTNFSILGVPHVIKKWNQPDQRFCQNGGSKRSNSNEKGGELDRKLRRLLIQNPLKLNGNFC